MGLKKGTTALIKNILIEMNINKVRILYITGFNIGNKQ